MHDPDATAVENLCNAPINSHFREDLYTNNIALEDALHHTNYVITMKDDNHVYMIKQDNKKLIV